ncbi:MAG TPA: hypothetical protein VFF27_18925 [Bacteroidia bacterium]|jgi:hypothetical protein|nr:hypothetical protein [Bacteroidia bacterium]
MKTLKFLIFFLLFSNTIKAQQVLPLIVNKKKNEFSAKEKGELNSTDYDKIYILGSGSTDALELNKLTASGGLGVAVKPSKRLTIFLNYNFGGNVVKKEKADSVYLSSFYFPDIASTAFSGSINLSLLPLPFSFSKNKTIKIFDPIAEHQLLITLDGSIQERNVNRDSVLYNLNFANFDVGPKYQWLYSGKNENNAIFTIGIFYNRVFINDNSKRDFNALFNPTGNNSVALPHGFEGISGLVSIQFNKALVYFRTYSDLNKHKDLAFSIGIKAVGEFFSF